jgi:hypothetical protein
MFNNDHDAEDECDDASELGIAEGKPPILLKQTEHTSAKTYSIWAAWLH